MLLAGLSQSALAIDWYVSGFVRQEGAYSIDSNNENPWNQSGNVYNGVAAPNAVDTLLGIPPGTNSTRVIYGKQRLERYVYPRRDRYRRHH